MKPQRKVFKWLRTLVRCDMKAQSVLVTLAVMCVLAIVVSYKFGNSVSLLSYYPFPNLMGVGEEENATLPDQYVVYECDGKVPCGGWADRQKGIVASFVLAEMLGRKFRIRMPTPCELSTHLTFNEVPWEIEKDEFKDLSVKRINQIDKAAKVFGKSLIKKNLTAEFPEDVISMTTNMELVHFLLQNQLYYNETEWMRNLSLADLYVSVLRKLFKLKPSLQERMDNFTASIPREKGVKLVCAQVRVGKNPTIPTDTEAFNTMGSVSAVWDFLSAYNDSSKYRIFVTSDSESVRSTAKLKFSTNLVDMEGKIVHVERTKGGNVCDGFSKVILDQLILSLCDVLVISRSGLARIAAWYRGKEEDVYCFTNSQVKPCDPYNLTALIPSW